MVFHYLKKKAKNEKIFNILYKKTLLTTDLFKKINKNK